MVYKHLEKEHEKSYDHNNVLFFMGIERLSVDNKASI